MCIFALILRKYFFVLFPGDINFSSELIEIRHRRMMRVILLHNQNASEGLIICANAHYLFHDMIENIPDREESSVSF